MPVSKDGKVKFDIGERSSGIDQGLSTVYGKLKGLFGSAPAQPTEETPEQRAERVQAMIRDKALQQRMQEMQPEAPAPEPAPGQAPAAPLSMDPAELESRKLRKLEALRKMHADQGVPLSDSWIHPITPLSADEQAADDAKAREYNRLLLEARKKNEGLDWRQLDAKYKQSKVPTSK